mmetsp:Transcript_120761/g.180380  ORF Transcript_120761/g.180380 Transcript_120761/m.180380 type:complete len:89 (-) Transcript_120761:270-536(-)
MLSIRLVLFLILLVLVQAETNSYFRGEKVIPASRVTKNARPNTVPNRKPEQVPEAKDGSDGILEFQSVNKVSGSKPVKGARNRRRAFA